MTAGKTARPSKMKTELKTLKDLRMEKVFGKDDYMTSEFVLKQEAIKWVKEIKISDSVNTPVLADDWITTFFNLTEEDLK